ncbi:MAG: hypothetical protein ACOC0A_00155 [Planctomycetota bacterium]
MREILSRLKNLRRDEDGQSLVFGVISIFMVLMFGAMVLGVGRVAARRIQMQFAADSSAYSAATMQAECLNAIAVINNTMARTRARALRYVSDVNMYGVLTELREEIINSNERQDRNLNDRISDLQDQLDDATDEEERESLQSQIDRITAQRESLYEDQDTNEDLLKVTDSTYWTQQKDVLEGQIAELEGEIEEASGERRDELEEELSNVEERLKLCHERQESTNQATGDQDPSWIEQIVGMEQPHIAYGAEEGEGYEFNGAYSRAEKWVPAAEQWLEEMSRLEHTIAVLAPYLTSETAYRVARKNGAEYVSIFPASRWLPRDNMELAVDVYRDEDPGAWEIDGGQTNLYVAEVDCTDCEQCRSCGDCERCWRLEWSRGASIQSEYLLCELEGDSWFIHDLIRDDQRCINQREEMYITTYGPEGVEVVEHGSDEGYDPPVLELINEDGASPDNTVFVRRVDAQDAGEVWDPDEGGYVEPSHSQGGVVQQAEYQKDDETGESVMPEPEDFESLGPTKVSVDGVDLSVTMDPVLPLPGQARVRRLIPPRIDLLTSDGEEWGYVELRDSTRIHATINRVHVEVRDGQARLGRRGQWISTASTSGEWRTHYDQRNKYWWQHRLLPSAASGWDNYWRYKYEEFGVGLRPENDMARLMGVPAADPDMARSMGFDEATIASGQLTNDTAESADLPDWAHYAHDERGNSAGWLNPSTGQRVSGGSGSGSRSAFYQERPCWYALCEGGELSDGTPCPVCGGDEVAGVDSGDVEGRLGRIDRGVPKPSDRDRDFLDAQFDRDMLPLVLTEDFFAYGVTVGVWHRRESHFPDGHSGEAPERPVEYLLHDPSPGMKGLMQGSQAQSARERGEILRPGWGYFAVAGARPRLNDANGALDRDGMVLGAYFRDSDDRAEWLGENMNNLYLRDTSGEWTYWDARLFPVSEQVLDYDVIQGAVTQAETGVGWLMRRIAHGSPGGLTRSRQRNLPPGYHRYGDISGWTKDIYGQFEQSYPPRTVRDNLLKELRPRQRYPNLGGPYQDSEGMHRDPLMEHLGGRPQGERRTGGQLDYNQLDDEDVSH